MKNVAMEVMCPGYMRWQRAGFCPEPSVHRTRVIVPGWWLNDKEILVTRTGT